MKKIVFVSFCNYLLLLFLFFLRVVNKSRRFVKSRFNMIPIPCVVMDDFEK